MYHTSLFKWHLSFNIIFSFSLRHPVEGRRHLVWNVWGGTLVHCAISAVIMAGERQRETTPSPQHNVMLGTMTIVWTDRPVTWLHHEAATMLICGHHRNKTPVPPLNIAPNTCSRCLLQATLAPSTSHFFTSSKTLIVTEKQRSLCTHSICLASYILAICLHKDNIVY